MWYNQRQNIIGIIQIDITTTITRNCSDGCDAGTNVWTYECYEGRNQSTQSCKCKGILKKWRSYECDGPVTIMATNNSGPSTLYIAVPCLAVIWDDHHRNPDNNTEIIYPQPHRDNQPCNCTWTLKNGISLSN